MTTSFYAPLLVCLSAYLCAPMAHARYLPATKIEVDSKTAQINNKDLLVIKNFILYVEHRQTYKPMDSNNFQFSTANFVLYLDPDDGQKNINSALNKGDFNPHVINSANQNQGWRRVYFSTAPVRINYDNYVATHGIRDSASVADVQAYVEKALAEIFVEVHL